MILGQPRQFSSGVQRPITTKRFLAANQPGPDASRSCSFQAGPNGPIGIGNAGSFSQTHRQPPPA